MSGAGMKAYCIVYETIEDEQAFSEYRAQVIPTFEPYGGRFLARGGAFTVLEGEMPYKRVVILEFPSRQQVEAWYNSPAYQRILPLRIQAGHCQFIVVDGLDVAS
jgi:uncharacterized protein (DUF1330 family)